MTWVLYIGGAIVGLLGLFFIWGLLHLRHSVNQAFAEIRRIKMSDLDALVTECVDVFQHKLGVRLDLNDCDDAIKKLDDAFLDRYKLKGAFARDDFYWHFVKPMGACLGELMQRHAKHKWRYRAGEALSMEVALKGGSSEAFPFEKMIMQVQTGEPGDLVAYFELARTIDQVVEQHREK